MALQGLCRLGDAATGVCNGHSNPRAWSGITTTATAGFTCDGIPVCRVGDVGITDCGHDFVITGGSSILTGADGIAVARVTSPVLPSPGGAGIITGGSPVGKTE